MQKKSVTKKPISALAELSTESRPFVVVETGGKQYLIHAGESIKTEKLKFKQADGTFKSPIEGETVIFDKILLSSSGSSTEVGAPYIEGKKVTGMVTVLGRNKTVTVMKYKPKSRYQKKNGHRQPFAQIRFETI